MSKIFSGTIKLANIDDYIAPSQQCIKPLMELQKQQKQQPKVLKTEIPMKIGKADTKATITLNDCLACSGCVTSAQSILIEQMSLKEFISKAKLQKCGLFISVQSRASLANHYSVSQESLLQCLSYFFKKHFNIQHIFDMQIAIDISHKLILQQYLKFEHKKFPVLCSQCPGWVCYAEKVAPPEIIQYMSKVKSPQQIMGNLMKQKFEDMYIVGIMPCYDKKLEAIRFNYKQSVKEVDLVLSTQEIVDLINEMERCCCKEKLGCKCNQKFPYSKLQTKFQLKNYLLNPCQHSLEKLSTVEDPKCNGYIHNILNNLKVEYTVKQLRNSDFIQYEYVKDGIKTKMAKCYGFRNIQNIVKQIKNQKCEYSYIQIMACPTGCFNGGGQIKKTEIKPKDLATKLEQDTLKQSELYKNSNYIIQVKEDYYTQYKAIEKKTSAVLLGW